MQMHATLVDDTTARLVAANFLGGNVEKDRDRPPHADELALAIVHVIHDKAVARGHRGNTGVPMFLHTCALCVDIMCKGNRSANVKAALYAAGEYVAQTLLADPGWLEPLEGVTGLELTYSPPQGDGMDSVHALRVELHVSFGSQWPPVIPDDFALLSTSGDAADDEVVMRANIPVPTE